MNSYRRRFSILVSGLLLAVGCADGDALQDAGTFTEPVDSGETVLPPDAGPSDAGRDGGSETVDSGVDASTGFDAGTSDGGLPPDAGVPGPLSNWCTDQPQNFSFFVTSMNALWALAGTPISDLNGGFGGDFGGVAGADGICQTIADATGHGHKTWRAFLSAVDDGQGNPVHAIARIGQGPWHDANGRLVATGIQGLLQERPDGDPVSTNDLPDECGVPLSLLGDVHDVVTGSNQMGMLFADDPESTCNDWTSSDRLLGAGFAIRCGHSFPRSATNGRSWSSDHGLVGCGKGADLTGIRASEFCIGCTGGYGALYCFAE